MHSRRYIVIFGILSVDKARTDSGIGQMLVDKARTDSGIGQMLVIG